MTRHEIIDGVKMYNNLIGSVKANTYAMFPNKNEKYISEYSINELFKYFESEFIETNEAEYLCAAWKCRIELAELNIK